MYIKFSIINLTIKTIFGQHFFFLHCRSTFYKTREIGKFDTFATPAIFFFLGSSIFFPHVVIVTQNDNALYFVTPIKMFKKKIKMRLSLRKNRSIRQKTCWLSLFFFLYVHINKKSDPISIICPRIIEHAVVLYLNFSI